MNARLTSALTAKDAKAIERQVNQQLAKILPKVVKSVLHNRDNVAAGIIIRNGVKQPAANDPAYMVWQAFEKWQEEGLDVTPILARKLAHELKQPSNVVVTDLYLWRKFNGLVK